jgi:hypothetical protein
LFKGPILSIVIYQHSFNIRYIGKKNSLLKYYREH